MAVPNLKHVVQTVRDSKQWPFRSKADLCAYTQAVIRALHAVDSDFGNLKKNPANNHCTDSQGRLHATDVALYKTTGQIVDFIASAGFEPDPSLPEPANGVTWSVGPEGEYSESSWFAPADSGSIPGPVDPPVTPDPLEPRVTALEAALTDLKAVVEANARRMEAINTRFDAESRQHDLTHKMLADNAARPRYVSVFGYKLPVRSE